MDYNSYFSSIDKIKAFLQKNYTKIDTAYIIYKDDYSNLDLDIVLWNMSFKNKVNAYFKKENISANIAYFTLDSFKDQFNKQLDKDFVFMRFANSWHIYGKSITNYYFKYLKEHFADEIIVFRDWNISIKDLNYVNKNNAGALVYNPKLKKFLLIRRNITQEFWNISKGGVEEGELQVDAAKREVFEETGIKKIKLFQNINFCAYHTGYKNNLLWKAYEIYYPAITYQENVVVSNEHSDFAWLSFDELINKVTFPINKYCITKLGSWLLEKYK